VGPISRCANHECGERFKLREGRLFHLRNPEGESSHSVEHFWLCESCAKVFDVERRDGKVVLLPIITVMTLL
jgi:hypothetical protein